MAVDALLSKLEGVRKTGTNRWRAMCPTHQQSKKYPSLVITEADDGRILMHCFAGCGAAEILETIGLRMTDLMPESKGDLQRMRRPWNPSETLATLALDAMQVRMCAWAILSGKGLSQTDMQRLRQAHERIDAAYFICMKESKWTDAKRGQYGK